MAEAPQLLDNSGSSTTIAAGRATHWLERTDGERYRLSRVATVGRAAGNDIRVDSPTVSRFHAILRDANGRWLLTDLDSRNGTRVNGDAIHAPRALRSNDLVQFGDSAFVFRASADLDGARPRNVDFTITALATSHFRLLFQPGSFAQQQSQIVGERIERFYSVLTEALGATEIPEPIGVYLLDQVADPRQPGTMLDQGGSADPVQPVIYAVYRPESPGIALERSLLTIALRAAAPGAAWPDALTDGALSFVLQRLGQETKPEGDEPPAALVEALERDALPPLRTLVAGDGDMVEVAPLAIADFLSYAASKYGPAAVGIFLNQLPLVGPDKAARAATGRSLAKLDKAWRRRLRSTSLSSFRLFIALLAPYLRQYRWKIAEIMIYLTFSSAFGVALAKINGYLIDRALVPRDRYAFEVLMLALVVLFVTASLASLRETYLTSWVSERILRELRLSMFDKVQTLHPGYFDQIDSGDLLTRMTDDLLTVEAALESGVVGAVRMTLMMALALVVIFFTEWQLAFIVVIALPVFLLVGRYLGRPVARLSLEQQNNVGKVSSLIQEDLGALPVVRLFGLQRQTSSRFAQALDTLMQISVRLSFLSGLYGVISGSAGTFIELSILGLGGYLVLHGHIAVGALFAFILLIGQVVAPMQSMASIFQFVQHATGSLKRVHEVIRAQPAIQDAPDARTLRPLAGEIRFEHVTFSYEGSRRILENISLAIPAGASVAFVGASGSGKSTMLNLLTRFYDPAHGRVLFDGVDLRQASLESLRGQMGMVFQETVLFNDSILENIRMGRPGASDAEVEAAARAAELHDFILQLPEGYQTMVGERGGRLSGGQRQRVAIARAIIRDPALLLLDEATSALDPATEASINATLRRVASGRTTVSVTHRLASVVQLDRIFVFDDGRLVEQGTHPELLAKDGVYARLWEEQQGATEGFSFTSNQTDVGYLVTIPLFAGLDQSTLLWLAANLETEHFAAGATIVRQGEPGDRLYVVREGVVDILVEDREGRSRVLAQLGQGDYLGEIALLRESPRTATVRARTAVEVVSLSRERFQAMLAISPTMREVVTQTMAQREAGLRAVAGNVASAAS